MTHARPDGTGEHTGAGPWQAALRRARVPLGLGVLCLLVTLPATEDLDPLLRWVGVILVVTGLVIVVATARTLSAGRR